MKKSSLKETGYTPLMVRITIKGAGIWIIWNRVIETVKIVDKLFNCYNENYDTHRQAQIYCQLIWSRIFWKFSLMRRIVKIRKWGESTAWIAFFFKSPAFLSISKTCPDRWFVLVEKGCGRSQTLKCLTSSDEILIYHAALINTGWVWFICLAVSAAQFPEALMRFPHCFEYRNIASQYWMYGWKVIEHDPHVQDAFTIFAGQIFVHH